MRTDIMKNNYNKYACILLSCTFHKINSLVECAPLSCLDWPCLVGLGLGVAKEKKENELKP